jgi:hypothetical protein
VSVQLDLLRDVTQRFRLAEESVLEQPDHAIEQGARRGFVVRLDGGEEDADGSTQAADARLLPVSVVGYARTVEDVAELAGAADTVFAGLMRDQRLFGFPRPTYSDASSGDRAEKPVYAVSWQVPIRYRVSVADPLVEA